ncbi:MAG: hypothetical protein WAP52_00305 [Candidatus Sungiibacteriota bacterium]
MFMEEKCCIEDWNGQEMTILDSLPHRVVVPILNKIRYYQNHTVNQLKNNRKFLESISGVNSEIVLWELKFYSDPPYRAICIVIGSRIIVLVMFQGSGSHGKVRKWVPKALVKAGEWYKQNNL